MSDLLRGSRVRQRRRCHSASESDRVEPEGKLFAAPRRPATECILGDDGSDRSMISLRRRDFLIGTAMLLFTSTSVRAATIAERLPWAPNAGNPPSPFKL